jgi:hypothetical protein
LYLFQKIPVVLADFSIENTVSRCNSRQYQAEWNEWQKIGGVAGCHFGAATNGHRGDHAIGQTAGTAASLVKQAGGQHSVSRKKWLRMGEDLPRNGFGGRIERSAQKFRPSNAADVEFLLHQRPGMNLCIRWGTGDDGLNQKIGVEMNHVE